MLRSDVMRCDQVNVVNSVNCCPTVSHVAGATVSAHAAAAPVATKAERLRELLQLLQQELITQEEYNAARASIIAS
jgi:hypothetical protein